MLALQADTADSARVRTAFLAATKKFHPNRFARETPEARDLATELFLLVRRAYTQLGDDAKLRLWQQRVARAQENKVPPTSPPTPPPVLIPAPPPPKAVAPPVQPTPAPPQRPQPPSAVASPVMPRAPAPAPVARARSVAPTLNGAPPTSVTGRSADEVRALLEEARTRGTRYEKALRLIATGDVPEARILLQKLVAEDPRSARYRARLCHALGLEHVSAGRVDEGIRELERAVALEPETPEIATALVKAKEKKAGSKSMLSKFFGR